MLLISGGASDIRTSTLTRTDPMQDAAISLPGLMSKAFWLLGVLVL